MPSVCYIDGKIVPLSRARVPVDDLGFQRGFGVFDFFRTYGGRPFRAREHLRRLRESAMAVGLAFPWEEGELLALVGRLLARAGFPEANLRLIASGGSSPDFLTPSPNPRLVAIASPLQSYPAEWYERGAAMTVVRRERSFPEAKTVNYLAAVSGIAAAHRAGAVEPLIVDREGLVREGETANFFAVVSGTLVTPGRGILRGVTRELVLELARGFLRVEERDLPFPELAEAEEAFITATNKEIVPVVNIGGRSVGAGSPGPETRKLMAAFRRFTGAFAASGA